MFADGEDLDELAVGRGSLDVGGRSDTAGVKEGFAEGVERGSVA